MLDLTNHMHPFTYFVRDPLFNINWCMGMTHRDVMGREVGGGIMFGNACKN